jgi:hypothetical protein
MDTSPLSFAPEDRHLMPAFVYVSLKKAVIDACASLKDAASLSDIAYIAWLARNVLELKVWIGYCASSEQRAEEFYEDSLRDLIDLNLKDPDLSSEAQVRMEHAKAAVDPFKAVHKFKRVGDAAIDIGMTTFAEINKLLSKFAHPTAMNIMASQKGAFTKASRLIKEDAEEMAKQALAELELSHLGRKFQGCSDTLKESIAGPLLEAVLPVSTTR